MTAHAWQWWFGLAILSLMLTAVVWAWVEAVANVSPFGNDDGDDDDDRDWRTMI